MKRIPVLHAFLFPAYPILFLFDRNIREYPLNVVLAPLFVTLASAAAAWLVLRVVLRNWRKAGIVVSLFGILFFSYGQLAWLLPDWGFPLWGFRLRIVHLLLLCSVALFVLGAYVTARAKSDLGRFTHVLNVMAVFLVITPSSNIISYNLKIKRVESRELAGFNEGAAEAPTKAPPVLPNIYYIVLDGYARADKLQELYGYDNSPFIAHLADSGFYVARRARSNYTHTFLSIGSALNMQYFDALAAKVGREYKNRDSVYAMLRHSRARDFVKARGYKFVSFATGFHPTEIKDADEYLVPPRQKNEFANAILGLTPAVSDETRAVKDRRRILYPFAEIPKLAQSREPLFVFAHIVAPHPPYVFNAAGGPSDISRYYGTASGNHLVKKNGITRAESTRRYMEQLVFLNGKVEQLVDALLTQSRTPPVIVLQGDHGPCVYFNHESMDVTYLADRMSILEAYYLPGAAADVLYDAITPVNTFRVIFNRYFGTSFPLLPDRNYYTSPDKPYTYADVTDEIDSAADVARYQRLRTMDYFSD